MRWVALTCLLVATTAHAQQPPPQQPADLTKEFQAGIDAFRLGKFDEARAHLEKARDVDPKLPGPYRFLAAVAQAQNKWDDCISNAHKALELNPLSSEAGDTRKIYNECRTSQGRTPYRSELGDSAAISVTSNVPGASVKINGLTYGATPLAPRPITAGELEISVDKQGWKPKSFTVNAVPGIVTDIDAELDPDATTQTNELKDGKPVIANIGWLVVPHPEGTLAIDGKPANTNERIELTPGTHELEVTAPGKDLWKRRVRISAGQKTTVQPELVDRDERMAIENRGLYAVGGGSVLLAAGFAAAMVSRSALNEAREINKFEKARDSTQLTNTAAPLRTRADLEDAASKAKTFAIISDVTYGVGLVAIGVGAYYLYKGAKQRTDVAPPFAIAPTHGGVFVAKEVVSW